MQAHDNRQMRSPVMQAINPSHRVLPDILFFSLLRFFIGKQFCHIEAANPIDLGNCYYY